MDDGTAAPPPPRKRKRGTATPPPGAPLVWARETAGGEPHPAHLLPSAPRGGNDVEEGVGSDEREGDGGECAWVRWASTGTVAQVPKSHISHELASRRGRRSGSSGTGGGAAVDKPSKSTRKKSRLSLTKEQRRHFQEHHASRKRRGRESDKGGRREQKQSSVFGPNQDEPGEVSSTSTAAMHSNNDRHEGGVDGMKGRDASEPMRPQHLEDEGKDDGPAASSGSGLVQTTSHSSSSKQSSPEVVVIDIADSEDEGEQEKKMDDAYDDIAGYKSSDRDSERSGVGQRDASHQMEVVDLSEEEQKSNEPTDNKSANAAKENNSQNPCGRGKQLQVQIPEPPAQPESSKPSYTHRSSAYVQHLAEACTLIMTDGRWRTSHTAHGEPLREGSRDTALFSWERGDDMSAVKAFMSLYDDAAVSKKINAEIDSAHSGDESEVVTEASDLGTKNEATTKEQDEVFERAMHLYSRLFHRKGPWFDLADLFSRYYAPKTKRNESMEREEISPCESLDSSRSDEGTAESKAGDKRRAFFAPRSSFGKGTDVNSSKKGCGNINDHQNAMEQLFHDIIRLLSMGLIRSFTSEYECGLVAGHATGRRGTLLLAPERREVLRRLGGGKSPKATGATTTSRDSPTNEILNQMQSQQSVLSTFAQTSAGGGGKAKATMLPVIKHVDKVLIRKLAVKVAALDSDAPRKSEIDAAVQMIHRAWAAACASHGDDVIPGIKKGLASAFRIREAPLKTLRRCMRLFLCAGGGPGAMRGDGTNGWISVLGEDSSVDPSSFHHVSYPGLSSRLGLERYELGHCYTPILATQLGKGTAAFPSSDEPASNVFARHCEFQLWEIGAELRSFIDRATEAYEMEKLARRRREKELSKSESNGPSLGETEEIGASVGNNAPIYLLDFDGAALLTEEGRKQLVRTILAPCFNEGLLAKHATTLDLAVSGLCQLIEADILSLSNSEDDRDEDVFGSDTERMIAAMAVICHRLLRLRVQYPSLTLISLAQRPWLRHMSFDSILTYLLWDCVPLFEKKGHHAMAVSLLQTILFGKEVFELGGSDSDAGDRSNVGINLRLGSFQVKASVKCLLPRRNRGKAYERLLIDVTHEDRRYRKSMQPKGKEKQKKSKNAKEAKGPSPIHDLCEALLRNAEASGSIPFCSLRNLGRRLKAPLPQSNERTILNIRPKDGNNWSPKTDCTVANAICSDSDDSAAGKRCAFVGWDDGQSEAVEVKRSLNVEELAMEEYHFGRLPCSAEGDGDVVKGQWVGWHNEGGHVRALFRLLCLPKLLDRCPEDERGSSELSTVFLTPYQSSPHDLHVGCFKMDDVESSPQIRGFYERRRSEIESFLSTLNQMEGRSVSDLVFEAVKKRWDRHADDRSRLKDPRLLKDVAELRTLSMVASAIGPAALAQILRTLSFDYRHWSGGLPDLFLVRARLDMLSASGGNSAEFVDLSDWIGEGFSKAAIEEKNIQGHISILADRDDEFLGCSKNADGSSSQQKSSRQRKLSAAKAELPSFPEKLDFMHGENCIKAECMFVEVKSANDRLSERQEDWLSILEKVTDARVCKFREHKAQS